MGEVANEDEEGGERQRRGRRDARRINKLADINMQMIR